MVSIEFDPDVFDSATVSTTIPASGMNAKLTYDSLNSAHQPLEIIVIVLCVLALIVMMLTSVSERMIGI